MNPAASGCLGGIGSLVSVVVGAILGLMAGIHYMRGRDSIGGEAVTGLLAGAVAGPILFLSLYCLLLLVLSRKKRRDTRPRTHDDDGGASKAKLSDE